jgi:hypothetical protein
MVLEHKAMYYLIASNPLYKKRKRGKVTREKTPFLA